MLNITEYQIGMNFYEEIVDKLLDLKPDPIPKFILLKEFKKIDSKSCEYQNLYDEVCNHKLIQKILSDQNERGFWAPFHGASEGNIRMLLACGLDKNHPSLQKVLDYLHKVLQGTETWNQFEKQDNPLWWSNIFVPLVCATMISLIDPLDEILQYHREQWGRLATKAFACGTYEEATYKKEFTSCFQLKTTRIIEPFNYYVALLLAPNQKGQYLDEQTAHRLVHYFLTEACGVCYVYNNKPGECIPISSINRDSRDFWNWIRSLSIIFQYSKGTGIEQKYLDWIMNQRNENGLWEFPKKFGFSMSNMWKGNSKVIDSSIYVLRLLTHSRGY